LCAEVFLRFIKDDFAVLRRFRGRCSLATYLTVVARRVVVKEILARKAATPLADGANGRLAVSGSSFEQRIEDAEEVESMLSSLQGTEAQVMRMYHLEGKNYYEISVAVGLSENSIGPLLSRAREKLRRLRTGPATSVPPIPDSLAR
jgi:RNA polymerase sigma-70 factor (ECF subfamily)